MSARLKVVTGPGRKVRLGSLAPGHTFVWRKCLWLVVFEDLASVVRAVRLEDGFAVSNFAPDSEVEPVDCQLTIVRLSTD